MAEVENVESRTWSDGEPLIGSGRKFPPIRLFLFFLGLSAVGISQPVLEILGSNPELVGATKASKGAVWVLVAAYSFGPPLIATLLVVISRRLVPSLSKLLTGALAWAFVLVGLLALFRVAANWHDLLVVGVSSLLAAAVVFILVRYEAAQDLVVYLSALVPLVIFQFSASPTSDLLDAKSIDSQSSFSVEAPVDVAIVVLDELPLWGLLTLEGEINDDLYPNFGRLAEGSTWYPNATSVASRTTHAVPAMLTSSLPIPGDSSGFAPSAKDNLFTVLGTELDVYSYESSTSLCPTEICEAAAEVSGSTIVNDLAIVYLHRILPKHTRHRFLPPIDNKWGGFGETVQTEPVEPTEPSEPQLSKALIELSQGPLRQRQIFDQLIGSAFGSESSSMLFYHGLVPHRPYRTTADGRIYRDTTPPLAGSETIRDVEDDAIEYQQRMMMQLGFVDLMIGDFLDSLQAQGKWDDTLVVVVADHGVSFVTGESMRAPSDSDPSRQDIFRVPLFVKLPGQAEGGRDNCPASTLDILPTVIETLEVKELVRSPGLQMVGSPLSECPGSSEVRDFVTELETASGLLDDGGLQERVEFYAQRIDPSGGPLAAARIGRSASLIGAEPSVSAADQQSEVSSWTLKERELLSQVVEGGQEGSVVPAQFTGEIELGSPVPVGTEGLILIDGVVAGVLLDVRHGAGPGVQPYSGIIAPQLLMRPDAVVELALHYPDGSIAVVGPPKVDG